jgi:hypothetical protein
MSGLWSPSAVKRDRRVGGLRAKTCCGEASEAALQSIAHIRGQSLSRSPALRRQVSTQFVQIGRPKHSRKAMACEVGVNHVSLARTSRKHCVSNTENAPVAQLDRAPPSEGEGHTFESCRARHSTICTTSSPIGAQTPYQAADSRSLSRLRSRPTAPRTNPQGPRQTPMRH